MNESQWLAAPLKLVIEPGAIAVDLGHRSCTGLYIHRATYSFEREGENLWVHTTLGAGGHLPEHLHPSLEEHWEALDGTARVKRGGGWRGAVWAAGFALRFRNETVMCSPPPALQRVLLPLIARFG